MPKLLQIAVIACGGFLKLNVIMKQSGRLSGNTFTTKSNGESKSYRVEEKISTRTREVSEDYSEKYQHSTKVAYDDSSSRVGTIENGCTGQSFVLNTNNK